jgi:hypothetical protein
MQQMKFLTGCQWLMPVIISIWKAKIKGSSYEPCPGKQFERPYLENTQHKKGLVEWLKWENPRIKISASKKKFSHRICQKMSCTSYKNGQVIKLKS